ncbi:hypothetical protein ABZ897_45750 [Nonomuraea sp. NPDC046802]|uniref:hypothetical protein n=1 Tax=Nonomuraea sp. NPDC046802 TaxID=3154919 RepID=UPI0033DDC1ED
MPPPRGRRHARPGQQVWPPSPRELATGDTQPDQIVQDAPRHGEEPPAARPKRRRRTLLVAAGAVVLALVTTAAQSFDGYIVYAKNKEGMETRLVDVPRGQSGKVYNIEWKAVLSPMKAPPDSKHSPDVAWLKVDISQKVLDERYATMTGAPIDARLNDQSDRTWVVELAKDDDYPTDKLEVGKEYKFLGAAVVPASVAGQVELSFRPSTYRSDTPTEELLTRENIEKEPSTDVLWFKR